MRKESARPAELLTIAEAAQVLAVSRQSIGKAVRTGDLTAIQAPGTTGARGLRILARSISDYIERETEAVSK